MIVTGRSGVTGNCYITTLLMNSASPCSRSWRSRGSVFAPDDVGESKFLELVSCHPGTNGVVVLHYRRRR